MITPLEIIKFNKRLRGWYKAHAGTAILVPGGGSGNQGQCVQAVDSCIHDVYGLPYIYGANAIDWRNNFKKIPTLKNNFTQVPYGSGVKPSMGWIIVYGAGVGSKYGHVDVCAADGNSKGFSAYDSNWDSANFHDKKGYPTLHQVQHSYANYILGYLKPSNTVKYRRNG